LASPYRIVIWQLLTMAVLAAAVFGWELSQGMWDASWRGFEQTVSVLAAGMASVLPAALYAWRASVERSATRFLLQGVLKFALTIVLVAACIILLKPAAAGFFGTLILLQLTYVVVPLAEAGSDGPG
jgi:F0F1-type ATP synthase assembly protein I